MTNNQGKISTKGIIILLSLFSVALFFIVLGVVLSYRNNTKSIIEKTLNTMSNTVYILKNNKESIDLNNNFTIESNIESDVRLDETNEDIKEYKDFLYNLSRIDTNIQIVQNKDNDKMLLSIKSKKNNEDYINVKYLIKDSTGYYYNSYITNKYINLGNNNYFETIKKDTTTNDNVNYIEKYVLESLSNNLANTYSKTTQEEVEYNNSYINSTKVSIELNNKKINSLYKDIVKDLKSDEKALFILDNYFEGFKDKKIKNKKYLEKNETLTINIYTTGLTNRFIKLEIIKNKDKEEKVINYEKIDNNISYLYFINNNNTKYKLAINKINDTNYNVDVFNNNNTNIGTIIFNKTDKETVIDVSINNKGKRLDIDYKYSLIKKKQTRYDETIKLDIKYLNKNNNVLTLSTKIDNKYTDDTSIKEDTTESILEKTLTEEQVERKNKFIENKLKDILGGLYEEKEQ